jgi:DNA-binding transcriptional LysR family regulator
MTKPPSSDAALSPMAGDRLQWMATFIRIVEAGSLSAAATQLRTTQPTISRRLQSLERSLGVRLLQRSTHAMRLTEDGERCYERAKSVLADWDALEADLRGTRHEPEGHLRVAVPHAFGQAKFVRPLATFMRAHPRVTVEWFLQDDVRDFIAQGIDCAIQVGQPQDPSVVAIQLTKVPRIVVAAPKVAAGRKAPIHDDVEALSELPWLALRTYYRDDISLRHPDHDEPRRIAIRPRFSTDSLYALRTAALEGLGVCVASSWLMTEDLSAGRLVRLAAPWEAEPLPVYLAYPHARHYPSRLLRFVATMRAAVPDAIQDGFPD